MRVEDVEILLVDDNPSDLNIGAYVLTRVPGWCVSVTQAGSGDAALKHVRDRKFQNPLIALVDFRMPGMDGIETIRQLRLVCPGCHAFLLTSWPRSLLERQLAERGAAASVGILDKPTDLQGYEELGRKLRDACGYADRSEGNDGDDVAGLETGQRKDEVQPAAIVMHATN